MQRWWTVVGAQRDHFQESRLVGLTTAFLEVSLVYIVIVFHDYHEIVNALKNTRFLKSFSPGFVQVIKVFT